MRSRNNKRLTVAGALVILCAVPVSLAVDASAAAGSPVAGGPVPGEDDDAHSGGGGTATSLSRVGTGVSTRERVCREAALRPACASAQL